MIVTPGETTQPRPIRTPGPITDPAPIMRLPADLGAGPDYGKGIDRDPFLEPRRRIYVSLWRHDASLADGARLERRGVKMPAEDGVGPVGIARHQRHGFPGHELRLARLDEAGAGAGCLQLLGEPAALAVCGILGAGALERGDAANAPIGAVLRREHSAGERCDLGHGHCFGYRKEPRLGHIRRQESKRGRR